MNILLCKQSYVLLYITICVNVILSAPLPVSGYLRCISLVQFNPFNPKLILQILPTIQEENDRVM